MKKNAYYKPLSLLPVTELSSKSVERVKDNKSFNAIKAFSKRLGSKDQHPLFVPLSWEEFQQWTKTYQRLDPEAMESQMRVPSKTFTVDNNATEKALIQSDSYAMDLNKNWLKRIQEDVYVDEAVHILSDYLNLTNHK